MASNTITTALVLKTTQFQRRLSKMQQSLNVFGGAAKTVGRTLQFALGGALIAAGLNAAKAAVDFDLATAKLKALAGPENISGVRKLSATARELGKNSIYTASQVAEMQLSLKKLGLSVADIDEMSRSVLNFATAMDVDVNTAGTTVVNTMKKFTNSFKEFTTTEERAAAISEQFAKATVDSALQFDTLRNSLNYVGAEANAAGFSFAETVAVLAKLADAGFEGSRAGVIFRKILQSIGKTSNDITGDFAGLVDNQLQFSQAMKIVGVRAAGGTLAIAGLGDEIKETAKAIESSTGVVDSFADAVDTSVMGRLKSIVSATEEVAIAFLNNFEVPIKSAISEAAKFIRTINSQDVRDFGNAIANIGKVIVASQILSILLKVGQALSKVWQFFKFLASPTFFAALAKTFAIIRSFFVALGGPLAVAVGVMVGGIVSLINKILKAKRITEEFEESNRRTASAIREQSEALASLDKLAPDEIARRLADGAYEATKAWQSGGVAADPSIIADLFVPQSTIDEIERRGREIADSGISGMNFEQAIQFVINQMKPKVEELESLAERVVTVEDGLFSRDRIASAELLPAIGDGRQVVAGVKLYNEAMEKTRVVNGEVESGILQLNNALADTAQEQKSLQATTGSLALTAAASNLTWAETVALSKELGEPIPTSAWERIVELSKQLGDPVEQLLNVFMSIGDVIGNAFYEAANGMKAFGEAIKDNVLQAITALIGKLIALASAYGLAAVAKAFFDGGTSIGAGAAAITASGFGSFMTSGMLGGGTRSTESNNRTVGYIAGADLVLTTGRGINANDRLYG